MILKQMQKLLDIDTGINIHISHLVLVTAPAALFTAETVWNTLKGPVGRQAIVKAMGANILWAQANQGSPCLEFCKKLGIG